MPQEVRVLHLLIKHENSRNPQSRRTGQSTKNVSVKEANAELAKYEAEFRKLKGQELVDAFKKACNNRSDCGSFKSDDNQTCTYFAIELLFKIL